MELHGTGTPLGDPIEVGAIAAVLAGTSATAVPKMLGASKSHLGHAEPAAGSSAVVRSATRCADLMPPQLFRAMRAHLRNYFVQCARPA